VEAAGGSPLHPSSKIMMITQGNADMQMAGTTDMTIGTGKREYRHRDVDWNRNFHAPRAGGGLDGTQFAAAPTRGSRCSARRATRRASAPPARTRGFSRCVSGGR
jgi:hypothetical protein